MRLLHGTTTYHVYDIRKLGLEGTPYVYLTDDPELAGLHACDRMEAYSSEGSPCRAVVCDVEVADTDKLEADPEMYARPYPSVRERHGCRFNDDKCWGKVMRKLNRERGHPVGDFDWEISLKEVNSVRHNGDIPASAIGRCRIQGSYFEGEEV